PRVRPGHNQKIVASCQLPVTRLTTDHWQPKPLAPLGRGGQEGIARLSGTMREAGTLKTVRIGNGCGFWGDNLDAPVLLAEQGRLDYLTLEYLAELTMSILALQKQRDPQAGFAGDFVDVLERLCPVLHSQPGLKVVT